MIGIRLHRLVGCWFGLISVFGVLLHVGSYRFAALLFQKSFSVRREVLALSKRITTKIFALLFGARARLALLHWLAMMGLPVALLAIRSLRLLC